MLKLFSFPSDSNPSIFLPKGVDNIKAGELLLLCGTTREFAIIDDDNGGGKKYGVPKNAGKIEELEISM